MNAFMFPAVKVKKKMKHKSTRSILPLSSCFDNRGKGDTQRDCLSLLHSIYKYQNLTAETCNQGLLGTFLNDKDFMQTLDCESKFAFYKQGSQRYWKSLNFELHLSRAGFRGQTLDSLNFEKNHGRLLEWCHDAFQNLLFFF